MDKITRRAAAIAADKLLAAAGYDPNGLTTKAAEKKRQAAKGLARDRAKQAQRAASKRKYPKARG
jgi:hypothetical protein